MLTPVNVSEIKKIRKERSYTSQLSGIFFAQDVKGTLLSRMQEDARLAELLYKAYFEGVDFTPDETKGYTQSTLNYKLIRNIIDKEARFMYSTPPDIKIEAQEDNDAANEVESDMQTLVDTVLEKNGFANSLLKAFKDQLITGRVAYIINFSEENGISVQFVTSDCFTYKVSPYNKNELEMIAVYSVVDGDTSKQVFKKKYWMDGGKCMFSEHLYDLSGNVVNDFEAVESEDSGLTFMPAFVIVNDGLSGDTFGESEVEALIGYEETYSKLANADVDAERRGMNAILYTIDAQTDSTKHLSCGPGAYWDIQSQDNDKETKPAQVGSIPPNMQYSEALAKTLARQKATMLEQIDMPDVSAESLKGVVSSGKTLKAIYWGLSVRCDEKMNNWRAALVNLAVSIIRGVQVLPAIAAKLGIDAPADTNFSVKVENVYSIPEDATEEVQTDVAKVSAKVMSAKTFIKKWEGKTDEEADAEIQQIALENEQLNNSFSAPVM